MTGPTQAYLVAHETHSAIVLLVGDHAYKVKKPVNLGFLDFSTLDARRAACAREVELNRRIAPTCTSVSPTWSPPTAVCASTWWSCGGCRPTGGCRRWCARRQR